MNKLSVVIIAFNEERNIARCLESVRSVADEIVVIDSFSTDNTVNICKSFGAKVISHTFEGHIQQKNYALEQASSFYVLSLDADEVLSEALCTSIIEIKSHWRCDAYAMNRLTNYCGSWIRHSGWYPDRKIRFFDKRKGKWTGTNPHDCFTLDNPASTVGLLNGDILHYSYYSISDHIKQVDYFTDISAKVLLEQRCKASMLRLFLSPMFRFVRDYILKFGFLDGYYGFVICAISSHAVFLKYVKLRELWKKQCL